MRLSHLDGKINLASHKFSLRVNLDYLAELILYIEELKLRLAFDTLYRRLKRIKMIKILKKYKTRRLYIITLIVSTMLLISCGSSGGGGGSNTPNTQNKSNIEIGAHYYLWYPSNFNHGNLRSKLSPEQEPLLGHYSSKSPQVAEQHIEIASNYGIDFFTLDWWPTRPAQNQSIKDGFLNASNISKMKFCIFYETIDLGYNESTRTVFVDNEKKQKFISNLKSIANDYFSHPQYYKVNGRPVIFFYVTRTLGGDYKGMFTESRDELKKLGYDPFFIGDEIYWISTQNDPSGMLVTDAPNFDRINLFDALTSYNSYAPSLTNHAGYGITSSHLRDTASLYDRYKEAAPNARIVPGVLPGYNDRGHRLNIDNYPIARQYSVDQNQGSMLREYLNQIGSRYLDDQLKMLVITSWNEWNEDTAIEPIKETPESSNDSMNGAYAQGLKYGGSGFEALTEVKAFSDLYEK